jgi:hypothetical protein
MTPACAPPIAPPPSTTTQRLEAFDSTRPAVESLNKLLLMAYRRVTEEMTAYA